MRFSLVFISVLGAALAAPAHLGQEPRDVDNTLEARAYSCKPFQDTCYSLCRAGSQSINCSDSYVRRVRLSHCNMKLIYSPLLSARAQGLWEAACASVTIDAAYCLDQLQLGFILDLIHASGDMVSLNKVWRQSIMSSVSLPACTRAVLRSPGWANNMCIRMFSVHLIV